MIGFLMSSRIFALFSFLNFSSIDILAFFTRPNFSSSSLVSVPRLNGMLAKFLECILAVGVFFVVTLYSILLGVGFLDLAGVCLASWATGVLGTFSAAGVFFLQDLGVFAGVISDSLILDRP